MGAYCETHYYRAYRNAKAGKERKITLEPRPEPGLINHSHGYKIAKAKGHPLRVGKVGDWEYEHRVVFYDAHGAGPFSCHWCRVAVSWADMHVDHINAVRHDNDVSNLVASCAACNQARGQDKMRATHRSKAKRLTFDGVTKPVAEWAKHIGITRNALLARIAGGWSLERAITEPRGRFGPQSRSL